ncbi:GDP-mannose 4,6-dehydratase [Thermodesulfobacteriota bacterium]
MANILILGSEGFTGKHFLEYLKKNNLMHECYLADRIPQNLIKKKNYYTIDLRKKGEIASLIRNLKPAFIFNFAGIIYSKDLKEQISGNVITTENLLSSIIKIKNYNPKVLLIGTAAEYGIVDDSDIPISETCKRRPMSNYGLSKFYMDKLAEKYIMNSDIRIFRTKTFNIMGPGMSEQLVVGAISMQIDKIIKKMQSRDLYIGNLDTERDFIDIRDVVASYWKISNSDFIGEVFNIGSGKPTKIRNILNLFVKYSGLNINIKQKKKLIKENDPQCIYADIAKVRKLLKWNPEITLEESIKNIMSFKK